MPSSTSRRAATRPRRPPAMSGTAWILRLGGPGRAARAARRATGARVSHRPRRRPRRAPRVAAAGHRPPGGIRIGSRFGLLRADPIRRYPCTTSSANAWASSSPSSPSPTAVTWSAAVSNAGGLGVLGAVGFSAEELETELAWLDEHVGDHPYGVDIVIPGKYEGMGELDPVKLEAELKAMVPEGHRTFAKTMLADHGVPELPGGPRARAAGLDGGHRRPPGRGHPDAPQGQAGGQRPGHPARGRHRAGPLPRAAGRRPGRVGQARPQPQERRGRHRHLPGQRGWRAHRRRRAASCCGPRSSTPSPHAGAGGGRHRQRAPDGGGHGHGGGRGVDRLAVADRRGGRHPAGPDGDATCRPPAATPSAPARSPASRAG